MTIKELDIVVLDSDLPQAGLKKGDVGTVVLLHRRGGYEVEFTTFEGKTIAVVSLARRQIRPVSASDVAELRDHSGLAE
jgi:hypothetical protein